MSIGIFLFTLILSVCVLFNFIINFITKKNVLKLNVKLFIFGIIDEFKMDTKIVYKKNIKPCYDLEEDIIYIEKEQNNLSVLCESLHEFGHAFINTFNRHTAYSKGKDKTVIYHKNKIIFRNPSTGKMTFIEKQNITEQKYYPAIINMILNYSLVFALLFGIFGVSLDMKYLVFVGIIFGIISTWFLIDTLLEECNASKIAYEVIINKGIITKNRMILSKLYLVSALLTYFVMTISSIAILIYQIGYLLT